MPNKNNKYIDFRLSTKDKLFIFLPIIFIILFVSAFFTFRQTSVSDFEEYVLPADYKGVIIKKYRHWNHDEPRLEITNENGIETFITSNWPKLYDLCEIGDSIYKKPNEKILKLKKKHKNTIIELDYFFDKGYRLVKRKY